MSQFLQKALLKAQKLDSLQKESLLQKAYKENLLYESVLSSLQIIIIISDEEHKVMYFSPEIPKVLDINVKHKNSYIWEFVKNQELCYFLKQSLQNHDTFWEQEFIQKSKVVSLSLSPYVQEGKLHGNILTIKDITFKKADQNNLEGSEALKTLIEMSSGMAHEIKNPLGAMSLHCQILEKSIEKKLPKEKLLNHTHIILEEIDRLSHILNQHLFALRPLNLPLVPDSLSQVVNSVIQLIKPSLEKDSIHVKQNLDFSLKPVLINERYFKQALVNLFENARIALLTSHKDPQSREISIKTYERENWIHLDIEDNGKGMDTETQKKFFKPYYSTKENSSGLGMSIIFKIVHEHKGKISYRSHLDQGTVFTLSLPIFQENQPMISFEETHEKNTYRR